MAGPPSETWTADIAKQLGASEEGLRLVLGQMLGYPITLIHHHFLRKSSVNVQHLYFVITGILVASWSISVEGVLHSAICVFSTWTTLMVLGGSTLSVSLLFIFNLSYLLLGYWFTETDGYDVTWTMPHCVLCLRLIGLAFDVADGQKPESEWTRDMKEAAVKEGPSILEAFSHSFFVGGYFVGPQFSLRKFRACLERNRTEELPSPVKFGFLRLALGAGYMVFHLLGSGYVPVDYLESKAFTLLPLHHKFFWSTVWVKVILAKYIAAWLFSEGACIISGLGYNGKDEHGAILWNGCANVKLRLYESCASFGQIIQAFNINTNAWVASYVYKRLKFMNNRHISQAVTLLFLAVWHGFHYGYYLTFFNEFIVMNLEKDMSAIISRNPTLDQLVNKTPSLSPVVYFFGKAYVLFFLPQCFIPFGLLRPSKFLPVLWEIRYCMYFLFLLWPVWSVPLRMAFPAASRRSGSGEQQRASAPQNTNAAPQPPQPADVKQVPVKTGVEEKKFQ